MTYPYMDMRLCEYHNSPGHYKNFLIIAGFGLAAGFDTRSVSKYAFRDLLIGFSAVACFGLFVHRLFDRTYGKP